ncbi:DNA-binding protein VF530 [Verrucomicrobia bacterium S94]|nr:DNA-binding protein VF530 [Verrucomicrobia bacterium S94]
MSNEELQNSPLHGLSTEAMLTELVEFYGWRTLDAAIELKCFRIQPTIASALAFLKKAEWARNRVEEFYLHVYKVMPKGSPEQMALKPRERGFPLGIKPGKPRPLNPEEIRTLQAERGAQAPPGKRAPKRPPRSAPWVEPDDEEPTESSFKSKFSNSPFKK